MVGETSFDRKAADWLSNREETAVKAAFCPTMLLLCILCNRNIVWFINVAYISSITLIVMQYNICKLKQKDCLLKSTETECKCFGIRYILLVKSTIRFSNLYPVIIRLYYQKTISSIVFHSLFTLHTHMSYNPWNSFK